MKSMIIDSKEALDEFNSCIINNTITIIKQEENIFTISYKNNYLIVEVMSEYLPYILFKQIDLIPKSYIEIDNIKWGVF